jgi:hypothetical protein
VSGSVCLDDRLIEDDGAMDDVEQANPGMTWVVMGVVMVVGLGLLPLPKSGGR